MAQPNKGMIRAIRSFCRATDGSITVEFVMWVPVFLMIFLAITDASLMFMHQSNFWNVSRDTARIVSRHGLDAEAAEAYARGNAAFGSYSPDVDVVVNEQAATVTVTISGKTAAMAPFGVLGFAVGDRISTRVTQSLEPI
jgi:Flp pilus assembly protein TadG